MLTRHLRKSPRISWNFYHLSFQSNFSHSNQISRGAHTFNLNMPYFSFFPFIYTLEWSFQIYMLFDCPWILYTCWKTEASAWFYYSCIELVLNVIDWFYEYDWSLLVQIDFSFNRCCRRIEWVLVCELPYLLTTLSTLLCWFEAALLTVTSAGVFISRFLSGLFARAITQFPFFPA